jgi:DNA-binding LytR/AlgR family response regulator
MSAPTPLAVLIARAEARALLWRAGELDLTNAVDELEAEAEVSGLLAAIGQDEVDAIIALAFAAVCDDGGPAIDGWTAAAVEYQAKRGKQTLIVEIEPERLARLRELMSDAVSLEHAAYEIAATPRAACAVATATLAAAEYLIQQNDAERLHKWLARHSAQERAAILQHLEQRKKVRPCQKRT